MFFSFFMETLKKVFTPFYLFAIPSFQKMIPKIRISLKLITRHKHEFYNL